MMHLGKNISQQSHTWFHPFLSGIWIKTKKFVAGLLWDTPVFSQEFQNWFWFSKKAYTPSGFEPLHAQDKHQNTFSPLQSTKISEQELIGNIDVSSLQSTNRKIQKVHLKLPYKTTFFDTNGKGTTILEKWRFVNFDNNSPILSKYDEKTGKYQAYARVLSVDTSDINTLEHTNGGYIRAPWLDGIIQRNNTTHSNNQIKPENNTPRTPSFRWYIGPDGQEIPEYILKSVTINYFEKVLSPKINTQLNSINQNIWDTRQKIIVEVMWKNIKASETTGYRIQQWYIKQRETWSTLGSIVEQIASTHSIELHNPNMVALIRSIQWKKEWQKLIQQASFVYLQQRKGRTQRQKTVH